jgi:hypothetical protein
MHVPLMSKNTRTSLHKFQRAHTVHTATLAPVTPPGTESVRIHLTSFDCGTEFLTRQSVLLVATVRFLHALLQNNTPTPPNLSRSLCNVSMSLSFMIFVYIIQSSAKTLIVDSKFLQISFTGCLCYYAYTRRWRFPTESSSHQRTQGAGAVMLVHFVATNVTSHEMHTAYSENKCSPNVPHTRGDISRQIRTDTNLEVSVFLS